MVTQVPLPAEEPHPTRAPSMGEEVEARKPESLVSDTRKRHRDKAGFSSPTVHMKNLAQRGERNWLEYTQKGHTELGLAPAV